MSQWYYLRHNMTAGPVSTEELRTLMRSGVVQPTDLIARASGYLPAREYTELFPAPQPASAPLTYQGRAANPNGPVLTTALMTMLVRTSSWTRFLAVMCVIAAAFCILGGICRVFGLGGEDQGLPRAFFMLFPIVGVLGFLLPGLRLNRFANGVSMFMRGRCQTHLESAFQSLHSFWRYVGILVIVVIPLSILLTILAILAEVARGMAVGTK